jgi:hypothetical protein
VNWRFDLNRTEELATFPVLQTSSPDAVSLGTENRASLCPATIGTHAELARSVILDRVRFASLWDSKRTHSLTILKVQKQLTAL